MNPSPQHVPVMARELLEFLAPGPGETFVDATAGMGGHAAMVLDAIAPDGRLLALDCDEQAVAACRERLSSAGDRARVAHSWFQDMSAALAESGFGGRVDGMYADLGTSALQLGTPARGFSFASDGPLDMRMDPSGEETAATLVARLSERGLADLLFNLGGERHARRHARAMKRAQKEKQLKSTRDLADLIYQGTPGKRGRIHPATRVFQALRIATNHELENLDAFLRAAPTMLEPGGRLAVIAFHSGEDRLVKHAFRALGKDGGFEVLTPKPIRPGNDEMRRNPRARSARLRAMKKTQAPK